MQVLIEKARWSRFRKLQHSHHLNLREYWKLPRKILRCDFQFRINLRGCPVNASQKPSNQCFLPILTLCNFLVPRFYPSFLPCSTSQYASAVLLRKSEWCHLQGKHYHRLSTLVGISPNSIAGACNDLLATLRTIYIARLRQLSPSPWLLTFRSKESLKM